MKLRDYIEEEGFKNKSFAKKLGISEVHLYRFLKGRKPSKSLMILIKLITNGKVTENDFENENANEKTA